MLHEFMRVLVRSRQVKENCRYRQAAFAISTRQQRFAQCATETSSVEAKKPIGSRIIRRLGFSVLSSSYLVLVGTLIHIPNCTRWALEETRNNQVREDILLHLGVPACFEFLLFFNVGLVSAGAIPVSDTVTSHTVSLDSLFSFRMRETDLDRGISIHL